MKTNLKTPPLTPKRPEHKDHNNALALIQSAPQLDQPTAQQQQSIARIYVEQAGLYFQERNWPAAILACKNALETDSNNAQAYKTLGNILKLKGKKAEALGVYAKALAANPNSAAVYANLGSFYAEQKKWQQARDYFEQAVILDPNLAGAYRSLAQVWEELGNIKQALEYLCQAVQLEPDKLSAAEYFSFGQELYQQKKIKEASIFYIQGVKLAPQATSELSQLVQMLEELEEWEEAVVYYHQLISLSKNPTTPSQVNERKPIKNLLSRGLLTKTPTQIPAKIAPAPNTTSLAITSHRPSSVKAEVTTPNLPNSATNKTQQPNSAVSWNNLGCIYAQKQQWSKAISCYQESLQLDPKLSKTYRNLAQVYFKMGKKSQAALCWYEVFILTPDSVQPKEHFGLAKSLIKLDQIEKAITCLRHAIRLKPDFNHARLILGKLYEKQGQPEAAKACYENVSRSS